MAKQLRASPCTVVEPRGAYRILLRFVADHIGKSPSALDWQDLDRGGVIPAFWDHLESDRHDSVRSRYTRFGCAALAVRLLPPLDIPSPGG